MTDSSEMDKGLLNRDKKEFDERMQRLRVFAKDYRKNLSRDDSLDQMQRLMVQELETSNIDISSLIKKVIESSPTQKSYKDIFVEVGELQQDDVCDKDLDAILEKVVQSQKLMPSKEAKERLFSKWDDFIKSKENCDP